MWHNKVCLLQIMVCVVQYFKLPSSTFRTEERRLSKEEEAVVQKVKEVFGKGGAAGQKLKDKFNEKVNDKLGQPASGFDLSKHIEEARVKEEIKEIEDENQRDFDAEPQELAKTQRNNESSM